MRPTLSILLLSLWFVLQAPLSLYASDRSVPSLPQDGTLHVHDGTLHVKGAASLEEKWEARLVAALRGYVARRLSASEAEIDIKLLSQGAWSGKASDEAILEIQERPQETLLGRAPFLVLQKHDGEKVASRWITADVAILRPVVVAIHPLKRFQPIEPTDVTIHAVRLIRMGDRYAVKPEELIGKRMVHAVGAGSPINLEMVEEAPLIRQGDRVTLIVDTGGLKIMTTGRAKEDGFSGRQVAVINLDSQKIVYGDVVDPSTVQIRFSNE